MRNRRGVLAAVLWVAVVAMMASTAEAKFRSLHRQTGSTHADVALQFVLPDQAGTDVLRSDLYGELSLGSFGAYAAIPLTNSIKGSPDVSTVGNLEFGVIGQVGPDTMNVVLHLGVAVPTAGDSVNDAIVNFVGSVPRIEDAFASVLPDTTSIRLGAAPRLSAGPVFVQGDLGFDFLIIDGLDNETAYHLGVGLGANLAIVELTAEIVHADVINANLIDVDGQTFTASATLGTPIVKPFVSYSTLIGDGAGDVHVIAFGASVGF